MLRRQFTETVQPAPGVYLIPAVNCRDSGSALLGFRNSPRAFCVSCGTPACALRDLAAESGDATAEPENLTLDAELSLSQAKQLGRNRVCGFDTVAAGATTHHLAGSRTTDPYQLHRFLRDGSLATMQALAAAVDAKDPYTQGHSRRVADPAVGLARALGCSEEIDLVYMATTLHDVGKIGVPDRILLKAGRLDDDERRLMETHPGLGEVIVGKVPQLARLLPGVRSHHERWDGHGCPDRLSGAEFPRIAPIIALADTFDAVFLPRAA